MKQRQGPGKTSIGITTEQSEELKELYPNISGRGLAELLIQLRKHELSPYGHAQINMERLKEEFPQYTKGENGWAIFEQQYDGETLEEYCAKWKITPLAFKMYSGQLYEEVYRAIKTYEKEHGELPTLQKVDGVKTRGKYKGDVKMANSDWVEEVMETTGAKHKGIHRAVEIRRGRTKAFPLEVKAYRRVFRQTPKQNRL